MLLLSSPFSLLLRAPPHLGELYENLGSTLLPSDSSVWSSMYPKGTADAQALGVTEVRAQCLGKR